jgi:polysaccharide deacetylase family protein (PEP-CTERM system associated)
MNPSNPMNPSNCILLTFDVEDWFQVENLKECIPFSSWDSCELRVEKNTHRLLDLLDEIQGTGSKAQGIGKKISKEGEGCKVGGARKIGEVVGPAPYASGHEPKDLSSPTPYTLHPTPRIHATFFVLGWIAKRLPGLVREIHSRGHEIASHGYSHELCSSLSINALREDLAKSKTLLEDITGETILGYRAPSFSVTEETLKVLAEVGYKYDSSYNSFAVNNRHGRIGQALRTNRAGTLLSPQGIIELPISNLTLGPFTLPWGGGGYFRLYPPSIFKWGVKRLLRDSKPYVFYAHPWEFDSSQPRVNELFFFNRFRHYINLHKTFNRLRHFLLRFSGNRFIACRTYLKEKMS